MASTTKWAISLFAVLTIALVACTGDDDSDATQPPATEATEATEAADDGGPATSQPSATATVPPPLRTLSEEIDALLSPFSTGFDPHRINRIGEAGDIRFAWVISDMLRFVDSSDALTALERSFWMLTGMEGDDRLRGWTSITNYLIAENIEAPEDYQRWKSMLYTRFGPEWVPFFDDPDAEVDWRLVSWGGVGIDDRPIAEADRPCFTCIPALNDPQLTSADGGDWYPDERLIFGVEVNGEARAYPKNQMEVHEMVNDTIGGRRIGLVYCTLCGTAQAFFTDDVPDGIETETGSLELRTSGLLSRSNKVMFELNTFSFFDTFRGQAVSGPLQDIALELEPVSVSVTSWAEWKLGHPDTTIVAEDGGIGRTYPLDPLRGRDDAGPIFPIGDVDPRLPVQDQVLGVRHEGVTVAFPEIPTRIALSQGKQVEFQGVVVTTEAGALRASTSSGDPIATHQSFWFAWSQFFPDTAVWEAG